MNTSPEEWQKRHQRSGLIPQAQQLESSQNSSGSQQPNFHGFNTSTSNNNTNDGPAADAMAAAAFMGTNSANRGRMVDQQLDLESARTSMMREGHLRQNYPGALPHSTSQEFPSSSANTLFQQLQMQQQRQQQQELYQRPQMFQNFQNLMNNPLPGNYWPTATDSRLMQNLNYQSQFPYHSTGASANGSFGQPLNRMNYPTGMQSSAPNHMQHQGATPFQYDQIIQKDAINKHDVLCGRGGVSNTHAGNVSYREMVNRYKSKYRAATKKQKPLIAKEIVENIRNLEPPGRFLKKVKDHVGYEIIGDGEAVQKACQSLREGAAKKNQYDFKSSGNGDENIDSDSSAKNLEAPTGTQTFETRFKQLEEFKANFGHLRITPLLNGQLCAYCQKMRQSRRNETISSEMIEKLDALGFDWEFQPLDDDSKLSSQPEPVAGDKRKLQDCGPTKDENEPSEEPDANKIGTIKGVDEPSEEPDAKKIGTIKGVDEPNEEPDAKKNGTIKGVDEPNEDPDAKKIGTIKGEDEPSDEPEAKKNGTIKGVDEPSEEPEAKKNSTIKGVDEPSEDPEAKKNGTIKGADEPSEDPEAKKNGTIKGVDEPSDEPEAKTNGTTEAKLSNETSSVNSNKEQTMDTVVEL